jgi:hypothetical protein
MTQKLRLFSAYYNLAHAGIGAAPSAAGVNANAFVYRSRSTGIEATKRRMYFLCHLDAFVKACVYEWQDAVTVRGGSTNRPRIMELQRPAHWQSRNLDLNTNVTQTIVTQFYLCNAVVESLRSFASITQFYYCHAIDHSIAPTAQQLRSGCASLPSGCKVIAQWMMYIPCALGVQLLRTGCSPLLPPKH